MKNVIILIIVVLCSCGKKQRPPDVLSEEQMVKVMAEIYIAEERINRLGLRTDSATKVFKAMEGRIFEKTGVPDSVFRKSLNYYSEHPKQMEVIYTALVDSLNLREQRIPYRPDQQ
jgi:hypothetical protein